MMKWVMAVRQLRDKYYEAINPAGLGRFSGEQYQ